MANNWVILMPWKACPKIAFLVTLVLAGIAGVLHSEEYISGRARRIHEAAIVVDTHIDLPMQLRQKWADLSIRNATPHFDIPRAREGGMTAAFFAIYVPAGFDEMGGAVKEALELIDMVNLVVVAYSRDLEAALLADIRRSKDA
jgi:membrane dipeptidase